MVSSCPSQEQNSPVTSRSRQQFRVLRCQVDGTLIGTSPLVPVNDTSATPLGQLVTTSAGPPAMPAAPAQRPLSFAKVGRSVFSYTFNVPSSPCTHTIMAVAIARGTVIPISAPVVSNPCSPYFRVFPLLQS